MPKLSIDADALFRAVTACNFKLLTYHLDLHTGAITSRTLCPDEIADAPQGSSVKPLPKMGGDLAPKKDASPFGPVPVEGKKKLFADDDLPKKPGFNTDFWKRDDKKQLDPFGDGGFKRESGSRKLAEIFGGPPRQKSVDPFAKPAPAGDAPAPSSTPPIATPEPHASAAVSVQPGGGEDPKLPRIPVAPESQQIEWMEKFARDCGDPKIKERLLAALKSAKAMEAYDRTLRNYQRMGQQWERYFRKQALACAEAWLGTLDVEWELIES